MKKAIANIFLMTAAVLAGPTAFAQEVKAGDPAAGERKAAMCIGCHGIVGYQATFPEVYRVPMIAGQNAKYIVSSLTNYQKGERRHPSMRGIAGSLNETDMADLAAFYEAQNKGAARAPEAVVAASESVGKLLAKGACASCHGVNFSKSIDPSYPKLAGQHPDYLYQALKGYRAGSGAVTGRAHAIMSGQAKPYSLPELKAMAAYIGSLPSEMAVVPQPKFISRTAATK